MAVVINLNIKQTSKSYYLKLSTEGSDSITAFTQLGPLESFGYKMEDNVLVLYDAGKSFISMNNDQANEWFDLEGGVAEVVATIEGILDNI